MAHDIFISHSSKDKVIADAICAGLEAKGMRCWIAPRDILPGQNYAGQLLKAIENCKVFIVVLSENAISSSHILKEVELAIESGLVIMPFRIQEVPLSDDLKYYLSNVHWLDALTPPLEKHIGKLADTIGRILEKPSMKQDQLTTGERPVEIVKKVQKARGKKSLLWLWFGGSALVLGVLILGVVFLKDTLLPKPVATGQIALGETKTPAVVASQPPTNTLLVTEAAKAPSQGPTALPTMKVATSGLLEQTSQKDGMTMVYVPAGEFLMGSATEAGGDEQPQHTVYLDAFWIDKTEVTNKMYVNCMNSSCPWPNEFVSITRAMYLANPPFNNYPVASVNWEMANAYCKWAGRSLPTEAQWEKAAKGGMDTWYPWGNFDPDDTRANYNSKLGDTTEVGTYPIGASPYGALDMGGNVWEWVADWYGYYWSEPVSNPTGPSTGEFRIMRGGSWNSTSETLRTTNRARVAPDYSAFDLGFRCALSD
jgi:formylglycine-generating enzyme required for sulfatase activity